MSTPDPIRRKKLSEEVRDRLLQYIREKNLAPGDVLPSERELMTRFQVGRPAIREAMQDLGRLDIIEIRHGGRSRVAQPSLDRLLTPLGMAVDHLLLHSDGSLEHLKQARLVFETEMARIAARSRTDNDLKDLENLIESQDLARDDADAFLDQDCDFHTRLAAVTGNPIFTTVSRAIFTWLRLFHVDHVRKYGLESVTLAEHRLILTAIARSDPLAAADAMRDHLTRANVLYHHDHRL